MLAFRGSRAAVAVAVGCNIGTSEIQSASPRAEMIQNHYSTDKWHRHPEPLTCMGCISGWSAVNRQVIAALVLAAEYALRRGSERLLSRFRLSSRRGRLYNYKLQTRTSRSHSLRVMAKARRASRASSVTVQCSFKNISMPRTMAATSASFAAIEET